MGWLKEWDKCVFKRANPVKKRRMQDDEEENPYVRSFRPTRQVNAADGLGRLPRQAKRKGTSDRLLG